jgi:segregation and condensation protein A
VPAPLSFHLQQYEGPLDLLLDLIRKQQIDIRDIPIATITSQYLEYLEKAREMDLEVGTDFIYMAATLIQIKSRMLLPRDPELEKMDPEGDPRSELVERLLEHQKFKDAAEMLQQKRVIEENVWSNPQVQSFGADEEPGLAITLFDLVKAFGELLERARNRPVYEVAEEDVSVTDMILYLKRMFESCADGEPLFIMKMAEAQRSRRAMIALFLAVLELIKRQAIVVVQKDLFGEIALRKTESFDAAFAADLSLSAVEEEYR